MTVGQQAGSGVEGSNKTIRKLAGCEEEESAERTPSEQPSTKRDDEEVPSPGAALASDSSPNPSGTQPNPVGLGSPPAAHDQHHFLRSSVRPPSKRIRKDGPAVNGHNGTKTKGRNKQLCIKVSNKLKMCAACNDLNVARTRVD